MIDRRRFLATLLGSAAGYALDVDKLLWVPGARTWFLPVTKPEIYWQRIRLMPLMPLPPMHDFILDGLVTFKTMSLAEFRAQYQ